ncbi:MAG: T9SS type A sorting domain-containing protein, partial [Ignavibacteria bacterium]|nr:T9SS type A sorting domain-containing protein [Ignavibacteria bacterium]
METVNAGKHEFNAGALASGTYILRISDEQAVVHKKIVKE